MKILLLLILLLPSLIVLGSKKGDLFVFPKFEFLETPLFDVLDSTMVPGDSLVFLPEDTMRTGFSEMVSNKNYDCYVYYNRGAQISDFARGAFIGDYIEQASKFLPGILKGFIVPVYSEENTRSPFTANEIFDSYWEEIGEKYGFEVIFIAEFKILSTLVRLEGYKKNLYDIIIIDRLNRGQSLSSQNKFYKKKSEEIPKDFVLSCDLRNLRLPDSARITEFEKVAAGRKKFVLFENSEDSIEAFALYLDSVSSKKSKN